MMYKPMKWAVLCSVALVLALSSLAIQFPHRAHASGGIFQQYLYSGPTGSRPYYVYTPANYQVGTPVPLIVMLHGCTQTPLDFATGTRMNQLADQKNFIVVYPQQTAFNNATECWNWFFPSNQVRDSGEPAIIAGITQTIEQNTTQWTIDSKRIYVTGASAGAAMAGTLGATYPDLFAAIGVHSGPEYQAATSPLNAGTVFISGGPDPMKQGQAAYNAMGSFARVVPTIVFQGSIDPIVHPINGDQVVQQWMQTDHLASNNSYNASFTSPSSTTNGQVPGGHSYTTLIWNDNNGNEVQEYWKVHDMGHAWSGGNPVVLYTDPFGPDASTAMYNFFINHPMP